jgi:hypothetical protein
MSSALRICTTLAIVTLIFATTGVGQQHPCPESEGKRALDETDSVRTWDALYKSYHSHRNCDDGAIGEGYSESVIRILADHWSSLSRLDALGRQDPEFRHFVLRHVDATLNTDDVALVKHKAKTECPMRLNKLCNDLAKQADAALNDASQ